MGYTKLFSEIVTSTIWQEPNDCRVLWITMLALKDEANICRATLPALAKICNLTVEQTEAYLQKFQEPDKYSRSQAFEGKRIELVDGGWLILNGQKYRDMLRSQERRDYVREKVAEHRARASVNKCKQSNQSKPISEAEAEEVIEGGKGETIPASQKAPKRATQRKKIPSEEEMPLTETMIEYLKAKAPRCNPIEIYGAFRDHHVAHGKLMADWQAAWRTWCRNVRRFNGADRTAMVRDEYLTDPRTGRRYNPNTGLGGIRT